MNESDAKKGSVVLKYLYWALFIWLIYSSISNEIRIRELKASFDHVHGVDLIQDDQITRLKIDNEQLKRDVESLKGRQ
jgi:hypothetical protein